MAAIKGVILDVDGTLVDSNTAHAHAWQEALAERGIDVPLEQLRRRIGMGGDKLLPQVSGITEDSPEGKALSKRRGEIFQQHYLPSLRPTPGAPELLRHLKAKGLRLVVASSAKKDELETLLRVCGADRVVEDRTSSDDAEESKPDPDIVHAALADLGLPPAEVMMLGDTPYDVEAANRAGVAIIALRCGGWRAQDLAGARAVYEDPADLLTHYDSSPLAGGK
jgi:HAD superfamily hydrolase (TIGR01509 family)